MTSTRPEARDLTAAASHLRLTLARVFGRDGYDDLAGPADAHLTPQGTIGIIDSAVGVAWDTGVAAHPDTPLDPGLTGTSSVSPEQAAQVAASVAARSPEGWHRLDMTPRYGTRPAVKDYAPDTWIRPTLAATGLPASRTNSADTGEYLRGNMFPRDYPHGVPDWIQGRSVTVLDTMHAARYEGYGHDQANQAWPALPATGAPRGSDEVERQLLAPFVEHLFSWARPNDTEQVRQAITDGAHPWILAKLLGQALRTTGFEEPWRRVLLEQEMHQHRAATQQRTDLIDAGIRLGMTDREIAAEMGIDHTVAWRRRVALIDAMLGEDEVDQVIVHTLYVKQEAVQRRRDARP